MSYICRKALSLGGVTYQPGDAIPDGAVLPSRVRSLTSCGYIVEQTDEPAAEAAAPAGENSGSVLYVPIKGDDDLAVPIPVDGAAFILPSSSPRLTKLLPWCRMLRTRMFLSLSTPRTAAKASAQRPRLALLPCIPLKMQMEALRPPTRLTRHDELTRSALYGKKLQLRPLCHC